MEIRKNSPLVSSGLGATSGANNSMLKRGSMNFTDGGNNTQGYPFVGLANRQYYTCFMNSILQCLVATPNLLSSLCSLRTNPKLNVRSSYKGKMSSHLIGFLDTYQNAVKRN